MTTALKILQKITTDYSIFEPDQVLNEHQLNSITDYLNDQTRLTRLYLLGVGVVFGLRVSLSNNVIKITPGIGATTDGDLLYYSNATVLGFKTDGDLLYYNNETVFNRFLKYDKSYPQYAPFYVNGNTEEDIIPVYELIAQDAVDGRDEIFSLSEFTTQTDKNLRDMVAVLLMETYVNDPDICTGTDCDNLGQDCINTPKLLLVDKASINSLLKPAIATPDAAFNTLNEIVADRPLISSSSINSVSELARIYRTVCTKIYNQLLAELPNLYLKCAAFLTDVFPSNPTDAWKTLLIKIELTAISDVGIQYYYDFLKDVVETYNQFRDLLFGDNTWCCPDINWFPKHLLLGNLVPSNQDENRTAFYPSPAVSQTGDSLNHAKFLARKLDTLIRTFQFPAVSVDAAIRITPSLFEDQPLEKRAIPYYYDPNNTTNSIYRNWNYSLSKRRMETRNYSYNATVYGAQGAAANPLTSQIGSFSFFRIEGHLGKNVTAALASIESEIKSKNLPFTVRSILLGQDKTKVVKKPGIRYTDLHRLHYLLRQDSYHQLNEVARFSNQFKQEVDRKVTEESNANVLKRDAEQRNIIVTQKAAAVAAKLNRNYAEYQADLSWQPDLAQTVTAASEFKFNIGDVVKTEFTTPFDTLIGSTHMQWLDWLDKILKKKDEAEDEKLLFSNFVSQNPGIEHFAGVLRGGTFILVHDNNNTVVADFMLPYYCEDKVETVPEEPPLTKPPIRPDFVVDKGIRVLPSFDKRFIDFKGVIEPEFTKKFDLQQKYFDIYKGFVDTSTGIFTAVGNVKQQRFTDAVLDVQIREVEIELEKVKLLKQRATESDDRAVLARAIQAEVELAQSLVAIVEYIGTSNISVAAGSEGSKAMQVVSDISVTIQGNALEALGEGLKMLLRDNGNNRVLRAIIENILSRLG